MKNCILLFLCFLMSSQLDAQLNMTYKSHVEYNESLNDVWGYAAPDGKEYALVGLRNGVSIIDVTDTENPEIKGYANGPSSTWRDLKTYGSFAYITNETSGGILVIDLSNLPAQLTEDDYWYWSPTIPGLGTITSCHNLYIDESGYAYLVGCDVNAGGMVYVDVFTNPGSPEYVGVGPAVYAHDIYVRDNKAYNSEIYEGIFTVYDVSDKGNTMNLGSQSTPFNFTHNAWLSDDSNYLFTTDEQANAPVGAYDISDLDNIQEVDQFRPLQTIGDGVIPHNVHVWQDWIVISYYTDGCIIVDGSRPHNLIEVGNFDTFIPTSTGFNGVWGAYPFLPSGIVLATDIGNGCYILEPDYKRACWLEGQVTDLNSGAPISGVSIDIASSELNESDTNLEGDYATGLATGGVFDVTFSHPAYAPFTTSVTFENGELVILNIQLGALVSQTISGQVVEAGTGNPIPNAEIKVDGIEMDFEIAADINGNFSVLSALEGDYMVYAGKWGYKVAGTELNLSGGPGNVLIELEKGYKDDFYLDLDWNIQSTAESGEWERGEPNGTFTNGGTIASNPENDVDGDLGDFCYVTGNDGGSAANDDIDNGFTRLTSPLMDLSSYNEAILKFDYWFFNGGGDGNPDDNLTITATDGTNSVILATIDTPNSQWEELEFTLSEFITLSETVRIAFESSDQVATDVGHLVEAGIDAFEVVDDNPNHTFELDNNLVDVVAMPNPFSNTLTLQYDFEAIPNQATLHIYNLVGQKVASVQIDGRYGNVEINTIRESGIYFLQIEADGVMTQALKVIKQ